MKTGLLSSALVLLALQSGGNVSDGRLLVESYGALLVIRPDGVQAVIGERANGGALSPDGKQVAYVTETQILEVAPLDGGPKVELARLPRGARLGELHWLPDGNGVAYQAITPGRSNDLLVASYPPTGAAPRNLGRWYQGFSFSPDGTRAVHAVNHPVPGLEVLDFRTGQRSLIHKAKAIVWDAQFSPDGNFIAYQITLHEPSGMGDEPNCTPPTLGLRVYSLADESDRAIAISDAPKEWDNVKSFRWSPDSNKLALMIGTTDCDYPGEAATVYVTTLDLAEQTRISQSDMAFEPVFSPSGAAVAFVDFAKPPAQLMRYDLSTGKSRVIRRATEDSNFYHLLDWK